MAQRSTLLVGTAVVPTANTAGGSAGRAGVGGSPLPQKLPTKIKDIIPLHWRNPVVFTVMGRTEMYLQVEESELQRIASLETQAAGCFSVAGAFLGIAIGLFIDIQVEGQAGTAVGTFLQTYGVYTLATLAVLSGLAGLWCMRKRATELDSLKEKHGLEKPSGLIGTLCREVNTYLLRKLEGLNP